MKWLYMRSANVANGIVEECKLLKSAVIENFGHVSEFYIWLVICRITLLKCLWQWHYGYYLVSFVINISGGKFEKHCFNISRDIVHSVICNFSCTPCDVINWLNLHNRKKSISLKRKKILQKKKLHIFFLKPVKYAAIIFHFIGTLNVQEVRCCSGVVMDCLVTCGVSFLVLALKWLIWPGNDVVLCWKVRDTYWNVE